MQIKGRTQFVSRSDGPPPLIELNELTAVLPPPTPSLKKGGGWGWSTPVANRRLFNTNQLAVG